MAPQRKFSKGVQMVVDYEYCMQKNASMIKSIRGCTEGSQQEDTFKKQIDINNASPEIKLVHCQKQSPLSLTPWLIAWNRFVRILAEKSNINCRFAATYGNNNDSFQQKKNWHYYDEQFLQLVSQHDAKWGTTCLKLYLKSGLDSNGSLNLNTKFPKDRKFQNRSQKYRYEQTEEIPEQVLEVPILTDRENHRTGPKNTDINRKRKSQNGSQKYRYLQTEEIL
ncbi:hypothetical protein CHS0354_012215 [Potamilus streckersoni]|uniref:Uncharacterized protein n=1 Tax=Potamilus streckersoni TaxID=2493646 RepID=A0AAE0VT39_9BIVA|nr:hypothetical protein CHS0354_012215 [Potamilus streckersoni]